MVRASRNAVVLALLLPALLAGCGGKKGKSDKVVARAGDIQVTLGDFRDAWNKITPLHRPDVSTLEGKRRFANDLLNQRILLAEARRLGGITDPQVKGLIEQRRRSEMLSALYRAEVETKVDVAGAEVEDLYEHRAVNVKASHILLDDMATARRIRDEIASGAISFEDAARRHSLDQSTKATGGSLGEIAWAQTLPEFQSRAFEAEPGTIPEPFETSFGVHVLRVDERIAKQLPTLEEMRVSLRNEVRRQKEEVRAREFSAALEQSAGLAWNEEGLRALDAAIVRMTEMDPDTLPESERYVPPLTDAERDLPVATFSGRTWTLGNYADAIRAQPVMNRPPARIPVSGLRELIRVTQVGQELAYAEAEARKLGDDPVIRDTITRLEEQVVLETLHGRFIQTADVTPEEVRAYFDSTSAANPEATMLSERVDMLVLANPSADMVRYALGRLRKGEDEIRVIRDVSLDLRSKAKDGRTGLIPRGNYAPQVEDVAFSGRVGKGWSEPIETEGGTFVVKVLAHEGARPAKFEEVEAQLTQALVRARGEAAFEEWLQRERDTRGVEIYDEALELYGQAVGGAGTAPPATTPPRPATGG